jgi:hypothetical protein
MPTGDQSFLDKMKQAFAKAEPPDEMVQMTDPSSAMANARAALEAARKQKDLADRMSAMYSASSPFAQFATASQMSEADEVCKMVAERLGEALYNQLREELHRARIPTSKGSALVKEVMALLPQYFSIRQDIGYALVGEKAGPATALLLQLLRLPQVSDAICVAYEARSTVDPSNHYAQEYQITFKLVTPPNLEPHLRKSLERSLQLSFGRVMPPPPPPPPEPKEGLKEFLPKEDEL